MMLKLSNVSTPPLPAPHVKGTTGQAKQPMGQFKHQTLTQTQTVITHEFSQLNVTKPHLRNIQS